jgi:SAM-dependent methyltransferase
MDQDYPAAAAEKIRRIRRLIKDASARGVELAGTRALELGCGPGIDSILLAVLAPGVEVVGVDIALPLLEESEEGARVRRLAAAVLGALGLDAPVEKVLADLPVQLERMSVTDLAFGDGILGSAGAKPCSSTSSRWATASMRCGACCGRAPSRCIRRTRTTG